MPSAPTSDPDAEGEPDAEDGERDLFTFDKVEKFFCAGQQLLFIVVVGRGFALHGEEALQHDSVNRKKDGPEFREAHQDGLMAGNVAGSFEKR